MTGRGHGRAERRTIQVLPAPDDIWPHAAQVFLIERYVYDLHGTLQSAVAALGLTALTAAQASPERSPPLAATWTGTKTAPSSAAAQHPRSWPACATSPPG